MKDEVNLAAWRLGVMLCLLTWLLSVMVTVVWAQYPTMIPVTDGLLTARPTTEPKRVWEERVKDEGGRMKEERLCDLCGSVVEIEQGDRKSLCDLCDSAVDETEIETRDREDETTEAQRTQREDGMRWIVLFRSICIGVMFVGSLVGMVVVLWRKSG